MRERFLVPDDSGMIGLVDPARYEGFVDSNWTLELLLGKFVHFFSERALLVWSVGCEGNWIIEITETAEPERGFRSVSGMIRSSQGYLYLTSYDDLTIAAQFPDSQLPQPHQEDLRIDLPIGNYVVTIVQLFDPSALQLREVFNHEQSHFQLVFTRGDLDQAPWGSVPWLHL